MLAESGRHGQVLHTYGAEDACALWGVSPLTFTEVFIKTGKRKERPLREMGTAVLHNATVGEVPRHFPYNTQKHSPNCTPTEGSHTV